MEAPHLPSTAFEALLRQINEACEKREEGKTNADYGASRSIKPKATEAGEEENRGRVGGERGRNRRKGLSRAWGFFGVAARGMSFGQKQRAVLDRTALWK